MQLAEGIIVKKEEWREADMLYTLYTREFGKIGILAKGARRIQAKLRPHLELFNRVTVHFIEGKRIRIATDARVEENLSRFLALQPEELQLAYQISEWIDSQINGEEKDSELWRLILQSYRTLAEGRMNKEVRSLFFSHFLFRLSYFLGAAPELYQCTLCRVPYEPQKPFLFRSSSGGLVCGRCTHKGDFAISHEDLTILRLLVENEWEKVEKNQKEKDLTRVYALSQSLFYYTS